MNRRDFLAGVATGVIAGSAGTYGALHYRSVMKPPEPQVAAPAPQQPAVVKQPRELRLVTTWPKNFPGLGTGAQRLADRITRMTGGALNVTVYAAGELVPALDAFDAVARGDAELYHASEAHWAEKCKAYHFFASVPGGLLAPEMNAWIRFGGGQELWDEIAVPLGVKPLLCGNTGMQMGGWFNRAIAAPGDFKGLKIQMPGLGGEVVRQLGAEPQSLPATEIFPALQSGAIDATEWLGPWNDLAFGFHKVAKYYYWPGFHEPGAPLALGINASLWGKLSTTEQEMIAAAAAAENETIYAEFMARNGQALQTLVHQHGVQLRKLPDDVLQALGKAIAEVMAGLADSDPLTRKVYDAYVAFRRNVAEWTALSEQGYATARSSFYS